jgi:hypothetical protein
MPNRSCTPPTSRRTCTQTQRDPTPGDRCWQAGRRSDDHRLLVRGQFIYDALYAWCVREVAAQPA